MNPGQFGVQDRIPNCLGFLGAHVGSLCGAEEEQSSWGVTGAPLWQRPMGFGSARRKSTNSGQRKGFCFQRVSQLSVAAAKILLALQKETLFGGSLLPIPV